MRMNKMDINAYVISIHAPHEGERLSIAFTIAHKLADFNPRSPRGGATDDFVKIGNEKYNFNPRSPRGGATRSCTTLFCV